MAKMIAAIAGYCLNAYKVDAAGAIDNPLLRFIGAVSTKPLIRRCDSWNVYSLLELHYAENITLELIEEGICRPAGCYRPERKWNAHTYFKCCKYGIIPRRVVKEEMASGRQPTAKIYYAPKIEKLIRLYEKHAKFETDTGLVKRVRKLASKLENR